MKHIIPMLVAFALLLTGCQSTDKNAGSEGSGRDTTQTAAALPEDAVSIALADSGITVDGEAISSDAADAVYAAHDIVFYLEGQGIAYGEGTEADAHAQSEADAHTVVHITQPGTYVLSGTLSAGQVAVDLGEDAEEDPNAVVTLVLNQVDITCTVAPAVIFYNVYECGSADEETAAKDVDTAAAGANVVIADGTENRVVGSYVARIYKPESVELNDAGTEVTKSKKLHKYDGAFYSKMSMNVDGGQLGSGTLQIVAENEGLDSELHLTINGGIISILSGNDGINTNEDNVSVTTINGGFLSVQVTGETGEGDGIDSNGWIVINGGTVVAMACSDSMDAGIDSDMGIYLNGGSVIATGNMLDRIDGGDSSYVVFQFAQRQTGDAVVTLRNAAGDVVFAHQPVNDYSYLVFASEDLAEGEYTLWSGETQLAGASSSDMGMMGMGQMPAMQEPPEGMEKPEGMQEPPKGMEKPEGMQEPPEGMEKPEGMQERPGHMGGMSGERSETFVITRGGSYFTGVAPAEENA